jgi:hypothetical protein
LWHTLDLINQIAGFFFFPYQYPKKRLQSFWVPVSIRIAGVHFFQIRTINILINLIAGVSILRYTCTQKDLHMASVDGFSLAKLRCLPCPFHPAMGWSEDWVSDIHPTGESSFSIHLNCHFGAHSGFRQSQKIISS